VKPPKENLCEFMQQDFDTLPVTYRRCPRI